MVLLDGALVREREVMQEAPVAWQRATEADLGRLLGQIEVMVSRVAVLEARLRKLGKGEA